MNFFVHIDANATDNGLANMLGTMIAQNLDSIPERRFKFASMNGRLGVNAYDADVACTLVFSGRSLLLLDGLQNCDLELHGPYEIIGDMSRMETGALHLPDPRGPVNQAVVAAFKSGRLYFRGLGWTPSSLSKLKLFLGFGDLLAIA